MLHDLEKNVTKQANNKNPPGFMTQNAAIFSLPFQRENWQKAFCKDKSLASLTVPYCLLIFLPILLISISIVNLNTFKITWGSL